MGKEEGWNCRHPAGAQRERARRLPQIGCPLPWDQEGKRSCCPRLGRGTDSQGARLSLPRYLVDSNVLLRFLTGEPHLHFLAAKALIESAEKGAVLLDMPVLVVAETAFTLESFYKRKRREVARVLFEFLKTPGIRVFERDRVLETLDRVHATGVHFVDAYLAAVASESSIPIASFDRDLSLFKDVKHFEPKP